MKAISSMEKQSRNWLIHIASHSPCGSLLLLLSRSAGKASILLSPTLPDIALFIISICPGRSTTVTFTSGLYSVHFSAKRPVLPPTSIILEHFLEKMSLSALEKWSNANQSRCASGGSCESP